MKRKKNISKFLGWLLILFFSYGMNSIGVADIEMALLEKNYAKAKQLASQFIENHPQAPEVNWIRYYLGLSQLYLEQFQEARINFQDVLKNKPDTKLYEKAFLGLIDAHYMDGDYENALKKTELLLKLSRNSEFVSLIYLKLARSHLKLAGWSKAKYYLDKIIQDFPESLEAHAAQQLLQEKQYFAVQVGSFINSERAFGLAEELQEKGEYAYLVETTDHQGRKFYRVRIGQFSRLDHAEDLRKKLSDLGYPTRIYP